MRHTYLDKLGRFLRSIGVGAVATVVDLVALVLLVELVGMGPLAANVPALVLGLTVQFFGNKYLAFRDRSRAVVKQGLQFALIEVGALVLNGLAFHIAVSLTALPYVLLRMLCTASVYVGYSFPMWGLIFRERPATERRRTPSTVRPPKETEPCST